MIGGMGLCVVIVMERRVSLLIWRYLQIRSVATSSHLATRDMVHLGPDYTPLGVPISSSSFCWFFELLLRLLLPDKGFTLNPRQAAEDLVGPQSLAGAPPTLMQLRNQGQMHVYMSSSVSA
jgi:hypothetical protein